MSAQHIIEALEKLVKLHKSFNQLALKKTEILKASDTDALTVLLMEEQKHMKAIAQTEQERLIATAALLPNQAESATISTVMKFTSPLDTAILEGLKKELTEEVETLKERNLLNQQLIYQSLQFINLSLNMVRPQAQNMNYGNNSAKPKKSGLGLFDSRA